ncbi:MAG TPA: succinate dehydrogenase, hydrophobic membrane anchor protein [Aestuariivirgaceae bacterium]
MRYRSSLARVRGLGAAKSGTERWWQERVSSALSIPATLFLIWLGIRMPGLSHSEVTQILGHPTVAIGLILALSTLFWHMMLGMQVIIEDYVHGASRLPLLIANHLFVAAFWSAGAYAVLRLSIGGQ